MNKLVVPVVLLIGGLGALMAVAISEGGVPEVALSGLYDNTGGLKKWGDHDLKVHGLLASIESAERPIRFTLKDKDHPEKTIAVVAELNRPDTFQVNYDVSVVGRYDAAAGAFRATKIFTKCPSKYEADEKAGIGSKKLYDERKAKDAKDGVQLPPTDGAVPREETGFAK